MNAEKEITIWGKGNEIRDFLYISDLIKFVELVIKNKRINMKFITVVLKLVLKY